MGVRSAANCNILGTGRRNAGASFDARAYGTPRIWYDSRYVNGIGVAQPADLDAIGTWTDLSANAEHVTQGTAGNKPTFRSKQKLTPSGLPVLYFDGTDYLRSTTLASAAQPLTTYIVMGRDWQASSSVSNIIIEHASGSGATIQVSFNTSSVLATYAGTSLGSGPTVTQTNAMEVVCSVANTTSSVITKYGGADTTGTAGTGATGTGVTIGSDRTQTANYYYRGWLACVVAYAAAHDEATRAGVLGSLYSTFAVKSY